MPATRRTVRDGLVVGLIGYAAVAIFYIAFDLLAARGTLFTINLLGQAVFRGLRDQGVLNFPLALDMTAIVAYNALHLVIALAIGLVVAGLVDFAERNPARRDTVRFVIIVGFFVTVAAVGGLTAPMRPLLPWWSIVVANALATALAGTYFVSRHPGLWRRLALVRV